MKQTHTHNIEIEPTKAAWNILKIQ
jgi:hypothetical protein